MIPLIATLLFSGLQEAFDRDWDQGTITYDGWFANASDDGVMAYKLLAQTGEHEKINRSIVCFKSYMYMYMEDNTETDLSKVCFKFTCTWWIILLNDIIQKIEKKKN